MPDIFISYSRKDSKQALQLAEILRADGVDVWIDQHGIEAATSWSSEIVQALDDTKAVVVLLSPSSIASNNVVRELSLAFEAGKPIVPVDLEPVTLPTHFRYQLAGIQRASITDLPGILRSLKKLGIEGGPSAPVGTGTPLVAAQHTTHKKSLVVIPFEDLSPGKDHDWFSDGLTYELIDTLSGLNGLFVIDRQTAREYKNTHLKAKQIASELDVRYMVTGGVQKSGTNIRISATLVDTETRQTLWNFKQNGVMEDIFDIQETVARKIAEGLLNTISPMEARKIEARATTSPEAYELYLQAMYFDNRNTKQDVMNAIRLGEQAIALDPTFTLAIICLANTYLGYYRNYDRSGKWLDLAQTALEKVQELNPDSAHAQSIWGFYYVYRGDPERAVQSSKKAVELDPANWLRWFQLGFVNLVLMKYLDAATAFEEAIQRNPESLPSHFNLSIMYDSVDDHANARRASIRGIPVLEKYILRHPDDQTQRMSYATMLYYAGRKEESILEVQSILNLPGVDSNTYYNAACLFMATKENERAMELFEKAIESGFRNIDVFKSNADNEFTQNDPVARERYRELVRKLEQAIEDEGVS